LHLTCDSPLIIQDQEKATTDNQKVLIPINSRSILFYGKDINPSILPVEFRLYFDLAVFHQAQRYVCGPDREYLETVANMYEFYKLHNQTHRIIPEVLEFL
jgi:hypothetical protein